MKRLTLNDIYKAAKDSRKFDAAVVLNKKIKAINDFFRKNKLDSAVIGLSGGIDSTVALYLLVMAADRDDSPIKSIVGLSLPISNSSGSSNQESLVEKIRQIKSSLQFNGKVEIHHMPHALGAVSMTYESWFKNYLQDTFYNHYEFNPWNKGQLDSILRTPALYYMAALMQTKGHKSIVCGTTNRDEGEYIGFYGKASDGMNDLQLIGDLHKSEVYAFAQKLNCPKEIIDATPRGDVHDNKTDEEMIGAPYIFLEAYVILNYDYGIWHLLYQDLSKNAKALADKYVANIERLHSVNLHKYQVGRPSHYVDVMKRKIKH